MHFYHPSTFSLFLMLHVSNSTKNTSVESFRDNTLDSQTTSRNLEDKVALFVDMVQSFRKILTSDINNKKNNKVDPMDCSTFVRQIRK